MWRLMGWWVAWLVLVACSGASAVAQEWTRFRGPNGAGAVDATFPVSWTDKDYRWKIKLPGQGHSQPVAWGDKLFVTSADPATAAQHVHCIQARDGKIVWQQDFPSKKHGLHALNTFASSTPCVDAERVYVAWSTPDALTLLALDHAGKEVWKKDLGRYVSQHGFGTSPIVHDGLVILGNDQGDESKQGESFLVAFDAKTGDEKWRTPRKTREVAYSTPCLLQRDGQPAQLLFNSGAHGFTSVDPATGKLNWELPDAFDKRSCSSPIVVAGLVFGSCGNGAGGSNYVLAIRPPSGSEQSAPKIEYRVDRAAISPYVPGFVAKGDHVFLWGDRGVVSCLDAKSGKILWAERVNGTFYGSPIRAGDAIYCMERKGVVVAVRAADKFEILGRTELGEDSNSTPAIAHNTLYLRTLSHLRALPAK